MRERACLMTGVASPLSPAQPETPTPSGDYRVSNDVPQMRTEESNGRA